VKPQTHDATRGVEGAFTLTEKFIDELRLFRKASREKGTELIINTILMPINYQEAPELVKWVQEKGLDNIHFQPMDPPGSFHSYSIQGTDKSSLKGADGEWYRENLRETTNETLRFVIDQLLKMKKKGYPIQNSVADLKRIETYYHNPMSVKNRCQLGVSSFNVRFCFDMNPIGNVLELSPKRLFKNKMALENRRRIKDCRKACHWAVC
jgi:MoaA/NifB/PqqE/SkfB family radical SAM enzyme